MQDPRPILLLTRPDAGSVRFARAFQARFGQDWPVVMSPLAQTEWRSPTIPEGTWQEIIFTSENGVAGFVRLGARHGRHAWCVGPRTACAARRAGFAVTEGPGTAAGLAAMIAAAGVPGPVLWPRGAHVAMDIPGLLAPAGIHVAPVIVYDHAPARLTVEAEMLLKGTVAILLPLFSPRSATSAGHALSGRTAPLWIAAISAATAEAGALLGADRQVIAEKPDSTAMLGALAALLAPTHG